jgi:hypothetical protein
MDLAPESPVPPSEMAAHVRALLDAAGSISSRMSLERPSLMVSLEEAVGQEEGVRLSGDRGGDEVDYLRADGHTYVRVDPGEAPLSRVPEWFELGRGSDLEQEFAEQIHGMQLLLALRLTPGLIESLDSLVFAGRVGDGNLWRYNGVLPYESLASRLPEGTLQAVDVARRPMPMFLFLDQEGVPSYVTYSVIGENRSQSAAQLYIDLGGPVDVSAPPVQD